jgi:formylmethanofuran dehydrogenase subunit E
MSDDIIKTLLESLTDEQKAQLVQGLLKSNENDEVLWVNPELKQEPEQKEEVVSSNVEVKEDFTVTRKVNESTRRNPVRAKKNRWVDDGSFQLEGEEEFSSGRKRTTRSRGKTKKVQLECSVCGKTYMEHPSLIYGEYHRCNRCGGR